jgi:hypothetical protein
VVKDFPDIFPEELPGMPLDREVEFVIDLLPGTPLTSKRPYEMFVEELKELKKQLTRVARGWVHLTEFFTLGSNSSVCTKEGRITMDVCGL